MGERVLVVNSTAARVDGRDVGRVLVLRDRTELSEALRALEGERTITDALRAQAHEFSNNLHVLSGMIELGRSEDAVGFIERVGGGSGAASGSTVRNVEDPAVAALVLAKTATAREQGLTLRLDPASEVADGIGDDVVTIVANLVDNALEACGSGGFAELFVYHRAGGEAIVRVSDDGPGVPGRVARADLPARREHQGLVQPPPGSRHRAGPGGSYRRTPGRGDHRGGPSRRAVPCSRPPAGRRAGHLGAPGHGGGVMDRSEPIRVLVVDDDFAVAEVHRAYVENIAGFSVVAVAHTGAQALRAAEERHPDLVLLDLHLPDMSGLEVLQRLRARADGAHLDILAITAAREVETVRTAMAGGVADYLIKPFPLRVFRERLESYAARRDKLRRLSARQATVQDQHEVDRLLSARPHQGEGRDLPKGLVPAHAHAGRRHAPGGRG